MKSHIAEYGDRWHPIDFIEPQGDSPNGYRKAGLLCTELLEQIDSFVSTHRDARKAWIVISVFLGLHSTDGLTVTEIAINLGVTKQALSRDVTNFGRLTGLEPAWGLKSIQARRNYQTK